MRRTVAGDGRCVDEIRISLGFMERVTVPIATSPAPIPSSAGRRHFLGGAGR